jgi:PAS domain S-box-containing protein
MDEPVRDGRSSAVAVGDGHEPAPVLHVDDEPEAVEAIAELLERADDRIEVLRTTGTAEGIERLDDGRIDCVVSGHDPPGVDGLELLRAVRESRGELPFVLFTEGGDTLAVEAISAGVTDYLPIRAADDGYALLAERVVDAVADRRTGRARFETAGRRRRERALGLLHEATRELMRAGSEARIADLAVRTARDVLGMPVTGCWLYDADADALRPAASTAEADALVGDPPTYREGEGLSWGVFETGESRVFTDVRARPGRYNPETVVRSEMILPLGEYGVLNVGSTEVDAFDDADVSLARVLAANTEAALARAEGEERLGVQRELIDAGLGALDDVFCVFDADGELVQWNDRVREATGYTDEELAGKGLAECLAPGDRDRIAPAVRDLHRTGRGRIEADLLTSDGERVPYEFTASSFDGSAAGPSGFVAVGRNVTARRERTRELERYEGIVEASGDPVYTLDADGRFTFVNDALVEMVGHDEASLLGSHVSAVVPPDEAARIERVIRSLLSSDENRATVELPIVTAEGRRIPCEAHITFLPFDREFRGTVGVVRDVSERIEHVRKLERLQQRTQELMHTRTRTETARVAVDTADEVLGVPLCGVNLLDGSEETLRPVATLDGVREAFEEPPTYHRASGAETDGVVWDVFEDGESLLIDDTREYGGLAEETPARSVVLHPISHHGVFIVSATEADAFDETDTVLVEILATALTAALDRVERESVLREREGRLERQNERLEGFASVVSHDLRNPLNVAMGSLDLARTECDAAELDAVADAHDRMEALIADLLALARAGQDATEMGPVSLAEAAERCWRGVETGDATLRIETDRIVSADENRLRQLLENLVRNAVEHGARRASARDARRDSVEDGSTGGRAGSGEDGGVTITLGDVGGGFYLEDDGLGIPEADRERVFEAGYSTGDGGTGFGLKIVADAARSQGWDVAAVAGTDGGARFEVTGVELVEE